MAKIMLICYRYPLLGWPEYGILVMLAILLISVCTACPNSDIHTCQNTVSHKATATIHVKAVIQ